MTLIEELTNLLNKYSAENESNTPDFILANFLRNCLVAFDAAVNKRKAWWCKENTNEN